MAVAFDTLKYAETLKAAGVSESQAKAQVLALADALKEGAGQLATREDLAQGLAAVRADLNQGLAAAKADLKELEIALKSDLRVLEERIEGRFRLLYWMVGFVLAMLVAMLWLLIRSGI